MVIAQESTKFASAKPEHSIMKDGRAKPSHNTLTISADRRASMEIHWALIILPTQIHVLHNPSMLALLTLIDEGEEIDTRNDTRDKRAGGEARGAVPGICFLFINTDRKMMHVERGR